MQKNNKQDILAKIYNFAINKNVLFYHIDHFKKDGVDNCDIYGYYRISLNEWIDKTKKNFNEDLREFGFWRALSLIEFGLVENEWIWTLDSMKSLHFDIAKQFFKNERKIYDMRVFEAKLKNISQSEIDFYLNNYYDKLSDLIWVSKNDPSVFVCDENFFIFDKPNGWSQYKIGQILEMWFLINHGKSIKSINRGLNNSYFLR